MKHLRNLGLPLWLGLFGGFTIGVVVDASPIQEIVLAMGWAVVVTALLRFIHARADREAPTPPPTSAIVHPDWQRPSRHIHMEVTKGAPVSNRLLDQIGQQAICSVEEAGLATIANMADRRLIGYPDKGIRAGGVSTEPVLHLEEPIQMAAKYRRIRTDALDAMKPTTTGKQ